MTTTLEKPISRSIEEMHEGALGHFMKYIQSEKHKEYSFIQGKYTDEIYQNTKEYYLNYQDAQESKESFFSDQVKNYNIDSLEPLSERKEFNKRLSFLIADKVSEYEDEKLDKVLNKAKQFLVEKIMQEVNNKTGNAYTQDFIEKNLELTNFIQKQAFINKADNKDKIIAKYITESTINHIYAHLDMKIMNLKFKNNQEELLEAIDEITKLFLALSSLNLPFIDSVMKEKDRLKNINQPKTINHENLRIG